MRQIAERKICPIMSRLLATRNCEGSKCAAWVRHLDGQGYCAMIPGNDQASSPILNDPNHPHHSDSDLSVTDAAKLFDRIGTVAKGES